MRVKRARLKTLHNHDTAIPMIDVSTVKHWGIKGIARESNNDFNEAMMIDKATKIVEEQLHNEWAQGMVKVIMRNGVMLEPPEWIYPFDDARRKPMSKVFIKTMKTLGNKRGPKSR